MLLSIVIPCFNEAEGITAFHQEITKVISVDPFDNVEVEMLFIDDGSNDKTLVKLKAIAKTDTRVRYLSFSRNFGKEAAILAGLKNAKGDFVAIMDADMQDPPTMLSTLYKAVAFSSDMSPCDIARMRRVNRKGEPALRSAFARTFYRIINMISDIEIADGARDYQIMNRNVVEAILSMHEYNRFFKGISSWVGFKTCWFEYENTQRFAGESSWSFFSLARYAIEGIVAFSTMPLVVASSAGIVCFVLALLLIAFIIARTLLFGDPVSGWPSTVCVILIVGGIQLLCIGILGQYLAKTYLETKRRPAYFIRESNVKS
ncbi:glycosyltransferase family 2 protein [Adlercreutzia sp. ZJ154]|uniref:glycosyltransferase family 2 protein n=1 Tax=Adlercreutzia sp. ZJ154 TaxID=2709790 RepID=UPI0013ED8E36|nr:glycosyltransferase family 2 protein [Adlercreutzia sp. ZJ154]